MHGQGEAQHRGALLAEVVNGLVESLRRVPRLCDMTFERDGHGAPRATLVIQPLADGTDGGADRFEFREAYWDDAFPPASDEAVTRWALMGLRDQIEGLASGWWAVPAADESLGAGRDWLYRVELALLVGLLALISAAMVVLAPVSWFLRTLARTPGAGMLGFTRLIANAFDGLSPFMQHTLGDSQRFITDQAWADNVRHRVEDPVCELLADPEVREVIIVGYSAGAAVAYDVLLEGGRVAMLARASRKPLRLFTAGSGLYHLWSFAGRHDHGPIERHEFATTRLDRWLVEGHAQHGATWPWWADVFARFDYVAAGRINPGIAALSGLREGSDYRSHRVINYDHLTDDHGGYFRNLDQVMPRLLATLFNDRMWAEPQATSGYTHLDSPRRARSVFWLNLSKLVPLVWLAELAALFPLPEWRAACERFGAWLTPGATGLPFEMIGSLLGVSGDLVASQAVIVLLLVVVSRSFYTWWRPMVDDAGIG